jgi:hypothetical protein
MPAMREDVYIIRLSPRYQISSYISQQMSVKKPPWMQAKSAGQEGAFSTQLYLLGP